MDEETITFVGGPRDGQSVGWRGGDVAEFPTAPPVLDFSVTTLEPFRHETAVYVRSLQSRHLFVFQP